MKAESQKPYKELCGSLDELITVYRALLKVVRREREILTSANLDELNENNKVKEGLLIKGRTREASRIRWTQKLAASEGLNLEGIALDDFARHYQNEQGERLRNYQSVLKLLLERVKKINKENEILVNSALGNITGAMEAIRDSLVENKTYKSQGKAVEGNAQSGQLVSREV